MFNRTKRIVGLDYGYSQLRAAEVEFSGDTARLVKWGSATTPAGALDQEGKVLDSALLSGGLRKVLQESGISTTKAVTMIPSAALVVRNFIMPYMEPIELKEAIIWEAAQHLPYPVDQATYDFMPISHKAQVQTADIEVLLISAHTPEVENLLQALHRAGIEPMGIDAQPMALARAMGISQFHSDNFLSRLIPEESADEVAATSCDDFSEAIIDFGAGTTDVSIFRDGYLRVNRSIVIGGNDFDQKLAERLDIDLRQAHRAKLCEAAIAIDGSMPIGESNRQTTISQAVQEVADNILAEIQRSLDYYRAQNGWIPIDRILATGGGARLKGLIDYLSNNLGCRIEMANPLNNLANKADYPPDIQLYSLAIGLALWKVTTK